MQEGEITPDAVATAFGKALRGHRANQNLSQEKLAELSNLDRTYISLLERGLRQPSLATVLRLCRALEIPPGEAVEDVESDLN